VADDDDLMDLDFTVPGAFDAKPEPEPAPAPVAQAPAPVPEPPPPPPPERPPLPPAVREAAELYAKGQELDAMRRLEAAIKSNENLGDSSIRAWVCLFELLQALGRKPAFEALALNDVVVNKGDIGRMIELEVKVDGELIHVLRADGLIVSTPTGSTAYALSANGPILHPSVPGIAIVPLCPHALSNRPITVSDNCTIDIALPPPHDARVHFDGQTRFDARAGDVVRLRRSHHGVTLLHPPGYSYFAMLREKLHWSSAPRH